MLGVHHHAISPPASKLNGITVLSPSTGATKLQSSPSLKNSSLKKAPNPTLDFDTSTPDIATAWPGLSQEETREEKREDGRGGMEEESKGGDGEDLSGLANGVNGDSAAVVDGDDGFADASRNLELDMAAIDAHLVQGFGSDSAGISLEALQPSASTIDSATDGPPTLDDEGQTIEAPESEATSPITPLEETISKTRKSSSPLSDLSPVPTHDEDDIKDEGADISELPPANGASPIVEALSTYNPSDTPVPDGLKPPEDKPLQLTANPSFSPLPPSSPQPSSSSQPQALSDPSPSQPSSHPPSANINLRSIPTNALAGPSKQPNGVAPSSTPSSPSKGDAGQKVEMILELNAELFRVCLAFQMNGFAMGAPEAQPFSKKLSSNLTWLAAHVDNSSKVLEVEIPLPDMDPPSLQSTNIAIPNIERIMSIYAQLPTLFAKDIARRERKVALQRASTTPSASVGPLPQTHRSVTPISRAQSVSSVSTAPLSSSGVGVKRERDGADHESPNSQKRQNTGDGRVRTPGPAPGSAGGNMLPPAIPDMSATHSPVHHSQQQNRPGSAMGMNMGNMNMNIGMIASPGSMMMSRSSSSGSMQSGMSSSMSGAQGPSGSHSPVNMQNMPGMPNVQGSDPQAIMRARQMQMRQIQLQQQQMQQSQMGMQGQQMTTQMQNAQQIQQQQQLAHSARQMSPPHGASGMAGGMSGGSMPQQVSLGMQNQPGGMANTQSAAPGANQVTPQLLQQIQALGPAAVQSFQALQNPQNPMVKYLKESIPGFEQLPLSQQLQRMQQVQIAMQRRNQANAANNAMMANPMMANQMRNSNMMASGSGQQNVSQHSGQGNLQGMGAGNIGMSQQMPQSTSPDGQGGMFRTDSGMAHRGMANTGMMNPGAGAANLNAMQMQMQQFASLNPQQRQLYLMQMQQQQGQIRGATSGAGGMPGGGGGGMGMGAGGMGMGAGGMGVGNMPNGNPGMMNAASMNMNQQMLAAQQQRLMAQRQAQGSPLNPGGAAGPSSGGELSHQQYPPGLRSNPSASMPGIARSTSARSPSISEMGGGTPRMGGRILPGQGSQNDEYHRALMQAQAQRSQMQHQQHQQNQQQNFMQGAGGQGQMSGQGQWANQSGMAYGAGQNMPSPNTTGNWSQQGLQQGYPMANSPGHQSEHPGTPRQSSSTPAPMIHHSPISQPSEFDSMMNW